MGAYYTDRVNTFFVRKALFYIAMQFVYVYVQCVTSIISLVNEQQWDQWHIAPHGELNQFFYDFIRIKDCNTKTE